MRGNQSSKKLRDKSNNHKVGLYLDPGPNKHTVKETYEIIVNLKIAECLMTSKNNCVGGRCDNGIVLMFSLKTSYLSQIYTGYLRMKLYVWDLLQNNKGGGEMRGSICDTRLAMN